MTSELLTQIFQVCIIPLLGVLTTFIIKWINIKSDQIQNNNDNEYFYAAGYFTSNNIDPYLRNQGYTLAHDNSVFLY